MKRHADSTTDSTGTASARTPVRKREGARAQQGCGERRAAMSKTAVAHPLVAGYLRQFDAAASILPMDRARELREQIVAHIEDAARPGASDEQIAAVLSGLGPARLLVAEAVAATGKRPWVSRVGWKGWTLIGALVLAVAAVSGYYMRIS